MASAFSHAFVAYAIGRSHRWSVNPLRFWTWSVACSMLPDLDVAAFAFGIPYEHVLGHRGLTHSLCFAFVTAVVVMRGVFPDVPLTSTAGKRLTAHFFLVTASHGVLDACTDGGLGVAFFAPIINERYFFPWTPVAVSPIGVSQFFSDRGMQVLASEVLWIGLPVLAWILTIRWLKVR